MRLFFLTLLLTSSAYAQTYQYFGAEYHFTHNGKSYFMRLSESNEWMQRCWQQTEDFHRAGLTKTDNMPCSDTVVQETWNILHTLGDPHGYDFNSFVSSFVNSISYREHGGDFYTPFQTLFSKSGNKADHELLKFELTRLQ